MFVFLFFFSCNFRFHFKLSEECEALFWSFLCPCCCFSSSCHCCCCSSCFVRRYADPDWGSWAGAFFGVYFGNNGKEGEEGSDKKVRKDVLSYVCVLCHTCVSYSCGCLFRRVRKRKMTTIFRVHSLLLSFLLLLLLTQTLCFVSFYVLCISMFLHSHEHHHPTHRGD